VRSKRFQPSVSNCSLEDRLLLSTAHNPPVGVLPLAAKPPVHITGSLKDSIQVGMDLTTVTLNGNGSLGNFGKVTDTGTLTGLNLLKSGSKLTATVNVFAGSSELTLKITLKQPALGHSTPGKLTIEGGTGKFAKLSGTGTSTVQLVNFSPSTGTGTVVVKSINITAKRG
jgi:hypothetical protein